MSVLSVVDASTERTIFVQEVHLQEVKVLIDKLHRDVLQRTHRVEREKHPLAFTVFDIHLSDCLGHKQSVVELHDVLLRTIEGLTPGWG